MKIKIIQPKIKNNRIDSFWYDGQIARIETKDWIYSLEAVGDIKVYFLDDPDQTWYTDYDSIEEALDREYTDEDLRTKVEFDNNNWFEVVGINKKTGDVESVLGDVADDYNEAIQLLKQYAKEKIYEK